MPTQTFNLPPYKGYFQEKLIREAVLAALDAIPPNYRDTDSGGGSAQTGGRLIKRVPTPVPDGVEVNFVLADSPEGEDLHLFLNGVLLLETTDYTYVPGAITMNSAPAATDRLLALYTIFSPVRKYAVTPAPDGVTMDFVLPALPSGFFIDSAALNFFVNGVLQLETADYTYDNTTGTITMLYVLVATDKPTALY